MIQSKIFHQNMGMTKINNEKNKKDSWEKNSLKKVLKNQFVMKSLIIKAMRII